MSRLLIPSQRNVKVTATSCGGWSGDPGRSIMSDSLVVSSPRPGTLRSDPDRPQTPHCSRNYLALVRRSQTTNNETRFVGPSPAWISTATAAFACKNGRGSNYISAERYRRGAGAKYPTPTWRKQHLLRGSPRTKGAADLDPIRPIPLRKNVLRLRVHRHTSLLTLSVHSRY
jgi:hypothetical protein